MKFAVCYNSFYVFKNKKELKKFFNDCYCSSEGSEQKRYATILINSDSDQRILSDCVSKNCNEIIIQNYNNFEEFLTISLAKAKTINETFEYFKKVIEPIMQVSEEFSVDYNKEIPFLYFGSDTESAYGQTSSFSDFYKGIMKKLNINIDNIWTNEWSDGKYIIKFNENEEFKTYAWESIGGVIDNVELIVSKMNEKEINIDI